jgi:hypothetical protein
VSYRQLPSLKILKRLFSYNPRTGVLRWRIPESGRRRNGIAGSSSKTKYGGVSVIGHGTFKTHRVIWKIVTGRDPGPVRIDHENKIRSDNRWRNLRELTNSAQNVNQRLNKYNQTGYRGITKNSRGGWRASICVNKVRINLGVHRTKARAHAAYCRAVKKYYRLRLTRGQLRR